MSTKPHLAELIDTMDYMIKNCDPNAVKLIPGRMLSIQISYIDKEINDNDYHELVNKVKKISESFSDNCKCIGK